MIDIKQINNQPYLIQLIKNINKSDEAILDISDLSQEDKAKVISAYTKFKFSLDSSGTKIRASLLVERTVEAPQTISITLEEPPVIVEDKIEDSTPPKKKKKDD